MESYWQQLIGVIVAPTVVVGAIAWLMRGMLSQGFARDLENHKSELAKADFEHRERFSLIHQRRADVIATLYGKIAKTRSVAADLVGILQHGGQSLMEKKRNTADVYNDMSGYFYENRIFLPNETAEKTEELVTAIRHSLIEFDTAHMGNDEYAPDQSGLWVQAFKRLRDEVPPILEGLEREFRELLGYMEEPTRGRDQ
jgi:hypothetical protein